MNKPNNSEDKYLNFLTLNIYLGSSSIHRIMYYFESAKKAYEASIEDYKKIGLTPKMIETMEENKKNIDLDLEMKKIKDEKIVLININDKRYPMLLKEIANPPYLLYCKGNLELLNDRYLLALVGSRKFSKYGELVCEKIIPDICNNNITIVSGMALGIDTLVHINTLKCSGKTIAVLGSGIDQNSIYPRSNLYLANDIIKKNGLLISEFPVGTKPLPQHFPIRNRIISGISLGVVVLEAKERSGSLITAFNALEQNREVFAVPGSIFSKESVGANYLIKKGAKLVNNSQDILSELDIEHIEHYRKMQKTFILSKEEEIIMKIISEKNLDLDAIKITSKFPTSLLISCISLLEMKGLIKKDDKNNYIKI